MPDPTNQHFDIFWKKNCSYIHILKLETVPLFYQYECLHPRGSSNIYSLMTRGLGDFFGSEILAKSDFLGSMKDAGFFLDHEKKKRDFGGLRKKGLMDCFGYGKKSSDFLG